jgi:hypothetical protein
MESECAIASLHISASGQYSEPLTQSMASIFEGFIDIFVEY